MKSGLFALLLILAGACFATPDTTLTPEQVKHVAQAIYGHSDPTFFERWDLNYAGFQIESPEDLELRRSLLDKHRAMESLSEFRYRIPELLKAHPEYLSLTPEDRYQVLKSFLEAGLPSESASIRKFAKVVVINDLQNPYLRPIAYLTPKAPQDSEAGYSNGILSRIGTHILRAARRTGEIVGVGANAISLERVVREYELDVSKFGDQSTLVLIQGIQKPIRVVGTNAKEIIIIGETQNNLNLPIPRSDQSCKVFPNRESELRGHPFSFTRPLFENLGYWTKYLSLREDLLRGLASNLILPRETRQRFEAFYYNEGLRDHFRSEKLRENMESILIGNFTPIAGFELHTGGSGDPLSGGSKVANILASKGRITALKRLISEIRTGEKELSTEDVYFLIALRNAQIEYGVNEFETHILETYKKAGFQASILAGEARIAARNGSDQDSSRWASHESWRAVEFRSKSGSLAEEFSEVHRPEVDALISTLIELANIHPNVCGSILGEKIRSLEK